MQSPTVSQRPNIATPGSDPQSTGSIGRLTGSGRKRKTTLRALESAAYFHPVRQRTKLRKRSRPEDVELDSMDGTLDGSVNDSMDAMGRLMIPWKSRSSTRRSMSRPVLFRLVQSILEHFMLIT